MGIILDREYRRVKAHRVSEDRKSLVRAFVKAFGLAEGLQRLSALTGHPASSYRRLAEHLKLSGAKVKKSGGTGSASGRNAGAKHAKRRAHAI